MHSELLCRQQSCAQHPGLDPHRHHTGHSLQATRVSACGILGTHSPLQVATSSRTAKTAYWGSPHGTTSTCSTELAAVGQEAASYLDQGWSMLLIAAVSTAYTCTHIPGQAGLHCREAW